MTSKRSPNVRWDAGELSREQRWKALGYGGATVWLTGLPAAGKSTIGAGVEHRLVAQGRPGYLLDGDNLRHWLNGDLGFSRPERSENIRRSGHVARLLADAGEGIHGDRRPLRASASPRADRRARRIDPSRR
jgi:bifunctional enzyme CysN/CysC